MAIFLDTQRRLAPVCPLLLLGALLLVLVVAPTCLVALVPCKGPGCSRPKPPPPVVLPEPLPVPGKRNHTQRPGRLGIEEGCGEAPLALSLHPIGLDPNSFVVNGTDQLYGQFPSFAAIKIDLGYLGVGTCGGTLVSDRHVLTAAHCIAGGVFNDKSADPAQLTVILGEHELAEPDAYEVSFRVRRVCYSPRFLSTDYETTDDWAVLELARPVQFNAHVQPACVPRRQLPPTRGPQARCFIVGAGAIGFDPPAWPGGDPVPRFPQVVQRMRVEQVTCRAWGIGPADKTRVCYTKELLGLGDSCVGDSGGPVLCLDEDGLWTVMGAVSYGTSHCDDVGPAAWIGVYTNVPTLLEDMDRYCMANAGVRRWWPQGPWAAQQRQQWTRFAAGRAGGGRRVRRLR